MAFAAALWGTVGVAGAILNRIEPTPPLTIGFYRLALSSPFLLGLSFANRRSLRAIHWSRFPLLAAMGGAMAVYQMFYFAGISLAGVSVVVVVALCSAPVIVAGVSVPLFKERITPALGLALLLAIGGTAWLALSGNPVGNDSLVQVAGALLGLGAGAAYAGFVLLAKIAAGAGVGTIGAISVSFPLGALLLLVPVSFTGSLLLHQPAAWLVAIYMGLVPTALAYLIYFSALRGTTATAATIITLMEPAVAAILAWLLLGERLGWTSITAMMLLFGAVAVLHGRSSAVSHPHPS